MIIIFENHSHLVYSFLAEMSITIPAKSKKFYFITTGSCVIIGICRKFRIRSKPTFTGICGLIFRIFPKFLAGSAFIYYNV